MWSPLSFKWINKRLHFGTSMPTQDGATIPLSSAGKRPPVSVDQFHVLIVHAISASKIGLTGYILPSRSNITIITNTKPIPPLG